MLEDYARTLTCGDVIQHVLGKKLCVIKQESIAESRYSVILKINCRFIAADGLFYNNLFYPEELEYTDD